MKSAVDPSRRSGAPPSPRAALRATRSARSSTSALPLFATASGLLFAAACLPNPGGAAQAPECRVDSDCPAAGEVCDEGLCWGDAPPGDYAALIGPPSSNRGDLVVTEIPQISIPDDGDVGDQIIDMPVAVGGRVHLACSASGETTSCDPSAAVAATVTLIRPSRITGGPEYVDSTDSDPSVTTGDSFTIEVPRLGLTDTPYALTVTPDDTMPIAAGGPTAAQLAPPLTVSVDATDDTTGLDLALGSGDLRTATGRITDATGAGVVGVLVSAQGRFDASRPLERVSTVGVTDLTGYYTIYIAAAALPVVDIVGTPAGNPGLTMRLPDVQADQPQQSLTEMRLPAAGTPIAVTLPIVGHTSAGVATPVAGAAVDIQTTLDDDSHPMQTTTYEVTASTDAQGNASLMLIPASGTPLRAYTVRINPAATSEFASAYAQTVQVGAAAGVLGEVDLPHRVAVTGSLVDADGNPAEGVTVTAAPALSFTLGLDSATQTLLSSLQPPTTTSKADGSFFVWVDPDLAGSTAIYDLQCVPPAGSRMPRWTFADVGISKPTLGALQLPRGRHVRGRVVDERGNVVVGSQMSLYQIVMDPAICMASNLPAGCTVPAALRSTDQSDESGEVRLVLPDPRP